jgi:hypothetical protein
MSNKEHIPISKTAIISRQKKSSALQHIMEEALENHAKKQQECINKNIESSIESTQRRIKTFSILFNLYYLQFLSTSQFSYPHSTLGCYAMMMIQVFCMFIVLLKMQFFE